MSYLNDELIPTGLDRFGRSDSLWHVHPLVIDSDVLMRNIVREARPGTPPTKLLVHAEMGSIRLFIASHQVAEVRRHLPRVARASGVDPDEAVRVFEKRYLPLLWQVSLGPVSPDDVLVASVRESDATDTATAQLAVLLGVRVLTENKKHFKEVAIVDPWLTVVAAYADVGLLEGTNTTAVVGVQLTGEGVAAGVRAARRGYGYVVERPRLAFGAGAIALIVILFTLWYLYDEKRRQRLMDGVGTALPKVANAARQGFEWYATLVDATAIAQPVLSASLLPGSEPSLEQELARALASSRWPRPTEELISDLSPDLAPKVLAVLETSPAFVATPEGWMVGVRAQNDELNGPATSC